MRRFKFFLIPIVLISLAIFAVFVLMSLWNWLVPELFGLGTITFLQALGLLLLLRILIGPRFGFPLFRRYAISGFGNPGRRHYWRTRMHEKWNNMNEEERAKFHNYRCGSFKEKEDKVDENRDETAKSEN